MNRVLFLHVGTHKTGTTSLQTILANNEGKLALHGVYLPKTGRGFELPGHHNLAWELNDDERFDSSAGNIQTFRDELSHVSESSVILSSEDFEYLYCRPDRLGILKSLADSLRYDIYTVVFFRDSASYANSLYAELTKHGLTQSVESFVNDIAVNGEFVFNERWRFCFEYPKIVAGFQSVFGDDRVLWRPYRRRIEEPFFKTVGLGELYERLDGEYATNESIGPAAVAALLAFNREAERQNMPLEQIYEHRDRILAQMSEKDSGVKFNGISGSLKDRLDRRFQEVRRWLDAGCDSCSRQRA